LSDKKRTNFEDLSFCKLEFQQGRVRSEMGENLLERSRKLQFSWKKFEKALITEIIENFSGVGRNVEIS